MNLPPRGDTAVIFMGSFDDGFAKALSVLRPRVRLVDLTDTDLTNRDDATRHLCVNAVAPHEVCIFARWPERVESRPEVGGTGKWAETLLAHLRTLFLLLQASASARGDRDQLSIVVVLDDASAMGEAGHSLPAAFAGAVLSMVRSAAIELRKRASLNTLLAPISRPDETALDVGQAAADLASAVAGFWSSFTGATGQEIFLSHGTDVGRLRP